MPQELPHVPNTESSVPSTNPVRYNCIDWDNCVMSNQLIQAIYDIQRSTKRDATEEEIGSLVRIYNDKLVRSFPENIEGRYTLFSSRTCLKFDTQNGIKYIIDDNGERQGVNIGSCFLPMSIFINSFAPDKFIPVLLADCFANTEIGTAFNLATQPEADEQQQTCPNEHDKILLTYLQVHHASSRHPQDRPIEVHLYDDDYDAENQSGILSGLIEYFSLNPKLIPKNVKLCLHHYTGDTPQLIHTIQGTGVRDSHYAQTIRWMAAKSLNIAPNTPINWGIGRRISVRDINENDILSARGILPAQTSDTAENTTAQRRVTFFSPPSEAVTPNHPVTQNVVPANPAAMPNRQKNGGDIEATDVDSDSGCCSWWCFCC